jgi:hypothetical protein
MNAFAALTLIIIAYAAGIAAAVAWARHCYRRRPAERDPHHRLYEGSPHAR